MKDSYKVLTICSEICNDICASHKPATILSFLFIKISEDTENVHATIF